MNEIIENNPEPQSKENSGTDRDSLGRKKRRWGFNREQRASLRKAAAEAESSVTDEHRLRLLWKENFEALDPAAQADLRQRESHVLYLTGSMLLFLDQFAKHPNDVLSPVSEPCSTFDELEEYLQKWPLLQIYLPESRTFSLIGIDIESQRVRLRIPDDADQRSGLMPITHSERCRSVIPGDADHSFRGDPDQLITITGRVITMPGMVIAIPRNVFHRAK